MLYVASDECLLSTVYTFSSVALPETLNAAQVSYVHGLVSISCTADVSVRIPNISVESKSVRTFL